MLVKVLAPGYFAREDTRTPVRFGIIAMVTNIVLNFALVWQFQHMGLALATSLSAFLNAGLLFAGLYRGGNLTLEAGWMRFMLQVFVASAAMLAVLIWLMPPLDYWLAEAFFPRLGMMLLICAAGAVGYATALLLVGIRFRELVR